MTFHSTAAAYGAFTIAAALMTVTPGLDTALVLRTAVTDGSRRAILVALGVGCGVLTWGALVAVGLGALLAASQLAYTILRWAGAGYLVYLGARMLVQPGRELVVDAVRDDLVNKGASGLTKSFARGFLTNVLNPKVGVFYVTFLPQFVPQHAHATTFILSLAAIHAVEGVVWFSLLVTMTRSLSGWLRRPRVVRRLNQSTGLVLIGFGARLVWSDR